MIEFPDSNIALNCPLGGIIFTLFRSSCQNVAKHVVLYSLPARILSRSLMRLNVSIMVHVQFSRTRPDASGMKLTKHMKEALQVLFLLVLQAHLLEMMTETHSAVFGDYVSICYIQDAAWKEFNMGQYFTFFKYITKCNADAAKRLLERLHAAAEQETARFVCGFWRDVPRKILDIGCIGKQMLYHKT